MVYCCVPFCKAEYGKYCGVSFHEIPSNDELREKWLDAISREGDRKGSNWIPRDRSYVCSLHFRNEDFKENCKRKVLKSESVPSLFPDYPVHEQQSAGVRRKRRTSPEGTFLSTSTEDSAVNMEEVVFIKCEPGLSMDEEDSSNFDTNVGMLKNRLPEVKAEPGLEHEIQGIIKEEHSNVDLMTKDDAVECGDSRGPLNTITSASAPQNAGQQTTQNLREKQYHVEKKNTEVETCTPQEEALQHANFKRQCASCGKIFANQSNLRRHCVRSGFRPHICPVCGRSFYQSAHLEAHSFLHSRAKPSCTKCKKSFNHASSLKRHQLVHMVDKPFSCSVCNKSFKHIYYLQLHNFVHMT